ncbi:hypothetical protein HC766_01665 [Candidatus Gracilibacteria bacterium]|nr:hypothetical protein [Candidatus Gracilibacteria bacterium]
MLESRIASIENLLKEGRLKRITYGEWFLTNPLSLVFYPTSITIVLQLVLSNWGTELSYWKLDVLTNGANWIIPLLVSVIGLVTGFGNKLYLTIQEKGDMDLLAELDRRISLTSQRLDRNRELAEAKRDAEQAKRDAEQAKRDAEQNAEIKAILKEVQEIKLDQSSSNRRKGFF